MACFFRRHVYVELACPSVCQSQKVSCETTENFVMQLTVMRSHTDEHCIATRDRWIQRHL